MKLMLSLFLALAGLAALLSGCSSMQIMDYPNLGLRIIRADSTAVHQACRNPKAVCCAEIDKDPCVIWASTPYCITHELRHCDLRNRDEEAARADDW